MKKLIYIAAFLLALPMFQACLDDVNDDNGYDAWREENELWLAEQKALRNADGTPYYTQITAGWNPNAYVLMHWHNNTQLTAGNISPISTSYVDVKYRVQTIDGVARDSSYLRTSPADSIYRSQLNSNIDGWVIGLTNMHVGDSVTMIVPYQQGYGTTGSGSIDPYSNLVFDLKLADVPGYVIPVTAPKK